MCTNLFTEGVGEAVADYVAGGFGLVSQSIDPPYRLSAHVRSYLDVSPDPMTALRTIAWVRALVRDSEDLAFVETLADVAQARRDGRLAVMLHSQTSTQFGFDLDLVSELHAAGLRVSGLAYNLRTLAADGCVEESNAGLSRFGRRLVQELNDVGIVVDGSHTGERSSLEAIDCSRTPVVFSHNGCRALHEHPRNLTDEQLRACAARGGVIGIVAIPPFLTGTSRVGLEAVGDHIVHAVEVAGAEHVGLGLDYFFGFEAYAHRAWPQVDPGRGGRQRDVGELLWDATDLPTDLAGDDVPMQVDGLETPRGLPALTEHLRQRGLSPAELRLILGRNWLRVLGECWAVER